MSKVLLKDVSKSYGDVTAIKNVNLEIEDKEFMVLVGPSGCGKSTVLRMIAGLEDISSGELLIGERIVNHIEPKDRNIAMVFQSYALYPHKNVYENLAFGLKMRKFNKDEIDKRVKKAASILHITEYLDRKPRQLSGGQRQRVALGRAIVRDPEVFLMDEPLSNLDAKLRVQMRSELIKLHNDLQTTFIYVTHDQVEAMTMGDRIAILNDGVIQQVDNPRNIYSKPSNMFVASFIGSPPMNFIEGEITDKATFNIGDTSLLLAEDLMKKARDNNYLNKKIYLGIRPEHFDVENNGNPKISVKVDLIEMLGSEKLLYFKINNNNVIAKSSPDIDISNGAQIDLFVEIDKAVLFDAETTANIDYL